jgi:hypothetical protein
MPDYFQRVGFSKISNVDWELFASLRTTATHFILWLSLKKYALRVLGEYA